jgi:hypothetical protein
MDFSESDSGLIYHGGQKMNDLMKHKKLLIFFVSSSLLTILVIHLLGIVSFSDSLSREMISDTSIRLVFGILLVILMYYMGYSLFKKPSKSWIGVVIIIVPGIIIAINNFPISAYLANRITITEPIHAIYLYAIECLSIGLLEETVFRGIILMVLLQRVPQTKNGYFMAIVISSAFFGIIHLLNLFHSASVSATLLQVSYSFLMGIMWGVIYLATQNLIFSIILHAMYDFFGQVLFRFGTVTNRFDFITILITSIFAVIAVIFYLRVFIKIKENEIKSLCLIDNDK